LTKCLSFSQISSEVKENGFEPFKILEYLICSDFLIRVLKVAPVRSFDKEYILIATASVSALQDAVDTHG